MVGVLFSIIAGMAMSLQGVWNTRLGDKIGLFEANLLVQGGAFLLSLIAWFIMGKEGGFGDLRQVNRLYLCGGILGLVITLSVMLGIKGLSPSVSIAVILVAQLTVAVLIDAFGLFDSEKIAVSWRQLAGAVCMIGGILLFKWQKR